MESKTPRVDSIALKYDDGDISRREAADQLIVLARELEATVRELIAIINLLRSNSATDDEVEIALAKARKLADM